MSAAGFSAIRMKSPGEVPIAATILLFILSQVTGSVGTRVFTVMNNCLHTICPAVLSGEGGGPVLENGGFVLPPKSFVNIVAPEGWSGNIWGRSSCIFRGSGKSYCTTGDCGNTLNCQHSGGAPPLTLAEFSLGDYMDFYDVSLVHGFNLPVSVTPVGGTGPCRSAGCPSDLRTTCPPELSVRRRGRKEVIACKSACDALGSAEYCCTGDHGTPFTCPPTNYSRLFKSACPAAYSYVNDDPSTTFTCSNASYTVTFCPSV